MKFDEYKGKKVLVTGHTGFKGSWLCTMLLQLGAEVYGVALTPKTEKSLYNVLELENKMYSYIQDIRNLEELQKIFIEVKPEIVFHFAAQPLVIESYSDPVYTYEVNVIGTLNVLECIRKSDSVKSFVNVTTDKVYENLEKGIPFVESDKLNGYDPYSNSKSCSELVTNCYKLSFLNDKNVAVSTCRAGNVIGGGDFSENRILPDCFRAALNRQRIFVRNTESIRPYQYVLEPLTVYLSIAIMQLNNAKIADSYNIGPAENDTIKTKELVEKFCTYWGDGLSWYTEENVGVHEASFLRLNCDKINNKLEWKPLMDVDSAIRDTILWYKAYSMNQDMWNYTNEEIKKYLLKENNYSEN